MIKEPSVDTNLLYIMIEKMQPGDIITYAEMVAALNRPWEAIRSNFETARRRAQRENKIVLVNIRTKGYQRAKDKEVAGGVHAHLPKIRRANRREIKRIQCIDGGNLDEEGVKHYNFGRTITSFLETALNPKSVLKIENATKANELPTGKVTEVLALFKDDGA